MSVRTRPVICTGRAPAPRSKTYRMPESLSLVLRDLQLEDGERLSKVELSRISDWLEFFPVERLRYFMLGSSRSLHPAAEVFLSRVLAEVSPLVRRTVLEIVEADMVDSPFFLTGETVPELTARLRRAQMRATF